MESNYTYYLLEILYKKFLARGTGSVLESLGKYEWFRNGEWVEDKGKSLYLSDSIMDYGDVDPMAYDIISEEEAEKWMKILSHEIKVTIITFSPTGGTLKCAEELAKLLGEIVQRIDLTVNPQPAYTLSPEAEVTIIAVPSYGGRMPSLAAERLRKIDGQSKPTALMAVYGNRAFEDTLAELEDLAKAQKFTTIAAVAAIAQHCMDGKIATGRPDADDLAQLNEFGQKIAEKLAAINKEHPKASVPFSGVSCPSPSIPGNRPYKKAGAGMQPTTAPTCTSCGLCARQCPAGAISTENPTKIDPKICLGCMRCVALCPAKAKRLPKAKRLLVHTFLSLAAGKRREPELFI